MDEKNALILILAICLLLIPISAMGAPVPSPAPWLVAWTNWVASVVGIVVAARVMWIGGDALRKYVNSS